MRHKRYIKLNEDLQIPFLGVLSFVGLALSLAMVAALSAGIYLFNKVSETSYRFSRVHHSHA